jgi:DNA polymerase-1
VCTSVQDYAGVCTAGRVALVRVIETELGPLRVVSTLEDAAALWDWTHERQGRWLGLDAETNAHDPFAPSYLLRTVQVADESSGWVIQAQRPRMDEVIRAVVHEHPAWVAWFARNDINFIERGVPGSIRLNQINPHVYDGQPALAWYDPRTVTTASVKENIDPRISRPRGLKPTAALNLGFDYLSTAEEIMHEKFRTLHKEATGTVGSAKEWKPYGFEHIDDNDEDYLKYAGMDSIVACRLWNKMVTEIQRRGQWNGLEKDLRLQWHYDLLQYRGLHLDGPYVRWLHARLRQIIEENTALLDWYHINPSAAGASIGRAFEWLGVQSPKETKTGAACWDKTVLAEISDEGNNTNYAGHLATAILAVRKAAKFDSSYIKPMLEGLDRDGRVHPDLRAVGTISSRNSASRPPLQQPPKREKKLKIRTALCAPPGWVLVTADLQQGEPRTMAGLSRDQNLKRDLLEGDLYSSIASLSYGGRYKGKDEGKKAGTESYVLRQAAKFAFLAWGYGCGASKLAGLLSVRGLLEMSIPEAQAAIRRWEAAYPDLIRFRDRVNQQPAARLESGWIAPLWDRYTVESSGIKLGPKPSRLALNYHTQGQQALLFRTALHRIIDAGWSWSLFWTMHDEALLCVPAHMADEAAALLKYAMTMDFNGIPIECDVDKPPYSPRWAEYPTEYLTAADLASLDEEILEGV